MEIVKFNELGLSEKILKAVAAMGFEEASPIQAKAIPAAMQGIDLIGQAQTGTGKTAAFGIPVLEKIDVKSKELQVLVLCPTRELAIQTAEEMRNLAKYMSAVKILPIYGGQEIVKQIRSLKAGVQIVIGTPGRVMDHMRRKTLRLDSVHTVVLDEADEMLNMGFRDDIETILKEMPEERQTLLFSATMPKAILDIAKTYQKDAVTVKVVKKDLTVPSIDQFYYECKPKNKEEVLCRLLDIHAPKRSLVFCNTKRQVDELVTALVGRGYFAAGLHGDMQQAQRDRVMKSFRDGRTDILVASDVAARGIDVDDVEAVFNYDLPQDDEYYVHRIGRTGRAGRTGKAFSFVSGKEVYKLKEIQRYCKTKIYAQKIPSMNDVAMTKMGNLLEQADTVIKNEDLTTLINAIEEKINDEDYTALDIAAALLKLAVKDNDSSVDEDEYDLDNTGAENGMVRLFINIGKSQKVSPKDILGAVAGESGIPGRLVGAIDIYDKYTFIEVPREYAEDVLTSMNQAKIKGKNINMEPANRK
ncbi:DEAD/DEAH box helicase [Lachnotalea sp. AF33-28]|uniref:DEAD/DEAH box helicase n=1 Tax=Lachnotalea sp. AF33-28 TaxID=2292046 RepID=UPI000E52A570|nr:DEAD/DEAH box helicase [Lachnotalea sp. AF33-28]RHP34646.1 ATP-dependent helicase [Lachnotalea sp. AF33-28]